MDDNIAIKVNHVSKDFSISSARANTLKSLFTGFHKEHQTSKNTQHALKDISFEVKKGEFFGIVGRNGSGKSTLLKIMAGIYQPNKGNVEVSGKLVPFIELGVGFNPELTGRENVYMNGALLGFSTKEVEGFYDEVVEFAELQKYMDKKLKNYSSGMQVRLAFSMAIRAKADILLIDEVLAVGDADFQRKCFEYFKSLKKSNQTVVFVSHDMEAVRQYCDRAILIDESTLCLSGTPEKVALAYVRQFNELSTDNADLKNDLEDGKRWGDGSASIDSVSVNSSDKIIEILTKITAKKIIEPFIVGIRIKSSSGSYVTGTNTRLEHIKIEAMANGDKKSIVWKMPNILSDGKYLLDISVTNLDELTVYDWWEDATAFQIKKGRHIPYSIDPGFNVEIYTKT